MIQLKAVRKTYREGEILRTVLDATDFTITSGEIVVLLGRSGSGKSTLLNLISGIDMPDSGQILIKDRDIAAMSEHDRTVYRRRHMGFVFQFFNLIPTLTVAENLLLPLSLNGEEGKSAAARVQQILTEVDLANRSNTFPDRLSGGEQQRVAIARALIHQPEIVLADEPTGNLDMETGKKVINLLDKLVRQQGKTMVMATHSREVVGLADRVVSLRGGKIVTGAPAT